ncbi:MAG TPA: DUF4397 domain-containing protein [Pseudomonadales bacterium]
MFNRVRTGALLPVLLGVLLGVVSGCGASDEVELVPVVLPRQGSIRVINAIPDASSITAFINAQPIASPNFSESSPLSQSLVGRYALNIVYAPPNDVGTTLVDNEIVDLTDPDEYSYLIIGPLATAHQLRVKNVEISYGVAANSTTLPPPDYQIVHAATNVGAADVYVTDTAADLANATPAATVSFGDVTPLVQLDPGVTYRVRVTPAGSKTPVLFDSGSYNVTDLARSIYLLLDHFGPGGEALRVADVNFFGAQDFANQTLASALRVANMIPTVAAVDVYLGDTSGTPIVANAPYGVTTAYVPVANGETTLTITPAGDPATTLASDAITIIGGQARTVYTSQQAPLAPIFAGVIESQRSIAGQAQLRLVAASPTAGNVDIYVLVPGQPISDTTATLGNAPLLGSTSTNLTPGTYDVIVTRSGSTVQLLGPERISLDAGDVYSAVLFDAPGGGTPLQLAVTEEVLP